MTWDWGVSFCLMIWESGTLKLDAEKMDDLGSRILKVVRQPLSEYGANLQALGQRLETFWCNKTELSQVLRTGTHCR